MKFSDLGIIISIKKYGENSLLIKIFSQNHGVFSAFVKSAKSSKDKVIFQVGNLISFEYRSRVEDNLGQLYYVDLSRSYLSWVIFDPFKIDCINSLFSIINNSFLEKESQEKLFDKLNEFLQKITLDETGHGDILSDYIKLELKILKTLGYGVDLSCCAVSNSKSNLAFVSPKSARAVSLEIGLPYQDKLLKLPNFLTDEMAGRGPNCLIDGLNLSKFFLEKFLFSENKEEHKFFSYRKNIEKIALIG
jgi:DNA repair protein RecO (recombination protein O)